MGDKSMFYLHRVLIAGLMLAAAAGASGQLLPPLPGGGVIGGVTGPVNDVVSGVGETVNGAPVTDLARQAGRQDVQRAIDPSLSRLVTERWVQTAPAATLLDLRRLRLAQLVKGSQGLLEMDGDGNPAIGGRLILIDPPQAAIAAAARAGFAVAADDYDAILGIRTVTVTLPRGARAAAAMRFLERSAPGVTVDYDHVFEPAGAPLAASSAALAAATAAASSGKPVIGMIDGGVGRSPAFGSAAIEQRGFAGPAQATGHGTAVASLIVGSDGRFAGAARGASLVVGDVYGGNPAAGSASAILKAMSWIAAKRPAVINVSLVGPHNKLIERGVRALQARGIRLVAAVGNDGPAAPPLYPASHPGVIAVTGADAGNRALPEAGRSAHLDYAGPGADMAAALPGRDYAKVRGTSFAAPFVASRLALTGSTARLDAEAVKGRGKVGRGVVCSSCRVAPKAVGAK